MTPVSHALLPVFFGQRWITHVDRVPAWREVATIAFCGVLPDVVSPHLGLDSRHASLSHTLWAFGAFALLLLGLTRMSKSRLSPRVAAMGAVAYGAHLACDAISGGIPWLLPVDSEILGDNYLPHWLWIVSDGALLFYVYLVYRWLPLRRRLRRRLVDRSPPFPP